MWLKCYSNLHIKLDRNNAYFDKELTHRHNLINYCAIELERCEYSLSFSYLSPVSALLCCTIFIIFNLFNLKLYRIQLFNV